MTMDYPENENMTFGLGKAHIRYAIELMNKTNHWPIVTNLCWTAAHDQHVWSTCLKLRLTCFVGKHVLFCIILQTMTKNRVHNKLVGWFMSGTLISTFFRECNFKLHCGDFSQLTFHGITLEKKWKEGFWRGWKKIESNCQLQKSGTKGHFWTCHSPASCFFADVFCSNCPFLLGSMGGPLLLKHTQSPVCVFRLHESQWSHQIRELFRRLQASQISVPPLWHM